ncbi:isoprenylcysteine carboxyl methyltransferase [Rhizoctonia solani 123E]|uniref:Isoprenylcysteine carboxyl methyltransferase n=1 Tax=Rhizoctonia solani 123E TaxID=1423351 RepID=A0A074SFS9_9AGAM|nr:isoprenylcysteine carboxyl methyltransferase [Rhizoctonia solani 123E]
MYIAGLNLPFTKLQALNGLAWASLAGSFYLSWPGSDVKKKAEEKAGNAIHMPAGQKGLHITIAHSLALFGPAVLFLSTLLLNKFNEPDWLGEYGLPKVSPPVYYAVRIGSSALVWVSGVIMTKCFKHLGAQWNYIGVRERPALVKTGPYKVVRHPMYSCAMLVMAGTAGAFWSWIPFGALSVLSALFAIKIPMEENVILNHDHLGPKYAVYRREVPYRIIPYIW